MHACFLGLAFGMFVQVREGLRNTLFSYFVTPSDWSVFSLSLGPLYTDRTGEGDREVAWTAR